MRERLEETRGAGEVSPGDVPEWGKGYLRRLTVGAQKRLMAETPDTIDQSLRVLLLSLCDEDGKAILDDSPEDLELLLDQPVQVMIPLLAEAGKLNGLTSEELEEAVTFFGANRSGGTSTE